jgi:hypothetical protein|tara:strand:+ start:760 stop:1251 length:492 start_codon:yes stop_codon:yes gene_type:complete
MSGENELSIEQLDSFVQDLEGYISSEGVVTVKPNPEIEKTINLTGFELKSLTGEECCEKAFCLQGYCNFLQKIYNTHLVRAKWCEDFINHAVSKQADNFDKYTKWEVKVSSVIRGDDFIQKVWRVKRVAEGRVTLLSDSIRDIRRQADTLLELSRKRRNDSYR